MSAFAPVVSPVETGADAVVVACGRGGDLRVVITDVDVGLAVVVICKDVVVRLMAKEVLVVPASNIINPLEDNYMYSPVLL